MSRVGDVFTVGLAVTPWVDEDEGIELVICEAGVEPHRPVWEVFRIVAGEGDCLAVHPWLVNQYMFVGESMEKELSLRDLEDVASQMACLVRWSETGRAPELAAGHGGPTTTNRMNCGDWT